MPAILPFIPLECNETAVKKRPRDERATIFLQILLDALKKPT